MKIKNKVIELVSPNVKYSNASFLSKSITKKMLNNYDGECFFHENDIVELKLFNNINKDVDAITTEVLDWFYLMSKKEFTYDVSTTGRIEDLNSETFGSSRFCIHNEILSNLIFDRLKKMSINQVYKDENDVFWNFLGVSKYWRFMKYNDGGEHYPHYDSDFMTNKNQFTKFSCVVYFTDCNSGEFAFVNHDGKDKSDWTRQAHENEISLKVLPRKMNVLIFPHTLCHTVLPFNPISNDEVRIIARGDLIYEKA